MFSFYTLYPVRNHRSGMLDRTVLWLLPILAIGAFALGVWLKK